LNLVPIGSEDKNEKNWELEWEWEWDWVLWEEKN